MNQKSIRRRMPTSPPRSAPIRGDKLIAGPACPEAIAASGRSREDRTRFQAPNPAAVVPITRFAAARGAAPFTSPMRSTPRAIPAVPAAMPKMPGQRDPSRDWIERAFQPMLTPPTPLVRAEATAYPGVRPFGCPGPGPTQQQPQPGVVRQLGDVGVVARRRHPLDQVVPARPEDEVRHGAERSVRVDEVRNPFAGEIVIVRKAPRLPVRAQNLDVLGPGGTLPGGEV
jgi:hypothetical protein